MQSNPYAEAVLSLENNTQTPSTRLFNPGTTRFEMRQRDSAIAQSFLVRPHS